MTRFRTGAPLILLAAVLWGTTGTAQALAPAAATPAAVAVIRMLIGGTALVAVATVAGRLGTLRTAPRWTLVAAAVGVAAYQISFFSAVSRTGVAVGTLVAIGTAPLLAGLGGRALLGESLPRQWWVATALAVTGVGLLATGGRVHGVDRRGVALAVAAAAAYALYAVAAKSALDRAHPLAVQAAAFGGAAVLLAPLALSVDLGWVASPSGAAVALHLGLVTTTLAYILFGYGLSRTPVSAAATLTLAEPATAALLGVLVLGERPGPTALAGLALVLAGLVVLTWRRSALVA